MTLHDLTKLSTVFWEIPKSFRADMRVPARVFASGKTLQELLRDRSLEQLINVATLPGIQKAAIAMPDAHQGFGFPVGGVAATLHPDGVISPGGIGYDINCGVRLLKSTLTADALDDRRELLAQKLYGEIPSGVGVRGHVRLSVKEMDQLLAGGAPWMIEKGYGEKRDVEFLESSGVLSQSDPVQVSPKAKQRGIDQVGTLGAGNHFVEVDRVDEIIDEELSNAFGLFLNQVVILIHTGSRGLGHQVATDYIHIMHKKLPEYGITLPDRELACAPFTSPEGKSYFGAMAAAANFAWANRQLITWKLGRLWREMFGESGGKLTILYDVAHNIAKLEEHDIAGKKEKVIVHRKGATRAFGPDHPELPEAFQKTGQPVLIPGSMGTASYVLAGTAGAMQEAFGSSCHGAGRRMSRQAAKREIRGEQLKAALAKEGIFVRAGSIKGLAEEAPLAYKDVHDVVDVVARAGIAKKVARLRPMVVVKG